MADAFKLKATDDSSNFSSRCDDVFAGLDAVKTKLSASSEGQESRKRRGDDDERRFGRDDRRRDDRGDSRSFRRPAAPRSRGYVPDHHKNPHKYTKYSLADVGNDQLSDRANSQAAFAFLRAKEEARRAAEGMEEEESEGKKIAFKKPVRRMEVKEVAPKATDKYVMPECVVGQKKKKEKREEGKKKEEGKPKKKEKQMTLSHLMDDEEDE